VCSEKEWISDRFARQLRRIPLKPIAKDALVGAIIGGILGSFAGVVFYSTGALCSAALLDILLCQLPPTPLDPVFLGLGVGLGALSSYFLRRGPEGRRVQRVEKLLERINGTTPWVAGIGFAAFLIFMIAWIRWMLLFVEFYGTQFISSMETPIFTVEGIMIALAPQMRNKMLRTITVLFLLFAILIVIMTFVNQLPNYFFWTILLFGLSVTIYGLDSLVHAMKRKNPKDPS
jgi:hypothetical protein